MVSLLDLFDRTTDGACGVDRQQRIVLWNGAAEGLLGHAARDVLGRRCYDVLRGCDEQERPVCSPACPSCARVRAGEVVPTRDMRVATRDGAPLWISLTTLLIPPPWRDEAALVHLFRDASRARVVEDAVARLVADIAGPSARPRVPATCGVSALTRREREVLRRLAEGASTPEIARGLGISLSTVRNHVHGTLHKLDAHSRLEAVMIGMRAGLLEQRPIS